MPAVVLTGSGERTPRQKFRCVDLRRDPGDADLHWHVLGDGQLSVGQVTLPRPLHKVVVTAAREPKCWTEQRIGMHGDEGRAVDRIAV